MFFKILFSSARNINTDFILILPQPNLYFYVSKCPPGHILRESFFLSRYFSRLYQLSNHSLLAHRCLLQVTYPVGATFFPSEKQNGQERSSVSLNLPCSFAVAIQPIISPRREYIDPKPTRLRLSFTEALDRLFTLWTNEMYCFALNVCLYFEMMVLMPTCSFIYIGHSYRLKIPPLSYFQ